MNDVIFREYDIRGKVDIDFTVDEVYDLTQAILSLCKAAKPQLQAVAIGMDGRTHSPSIKKEVMRAVLDYGLDAIYIGVCPTPALYFAMNVLQVDAGIMITASHNPKEYNGFKICLGKESVWGAQIKEIKALYKDRIHYKASLPGQEREHLIIPDYINFLTTHFQSLKNNAIKAVIDCANGSAGTVIPELVARMNWQNVQVLYPEVDGTYPNHEADPTVEKNMQDVKKLLQATDAAVGIGFDGDCDRMAPMTKKGVLVPGDVLLAVFAQAIIEQHPDACIVFDIKSSQVVLDLLEQWGACPRFSPSGHSIIKNEMKKHNALLAGELSCHFFFKDRYFGYDDGIYAMLRLFEILDHTAKSLDELIAVVPKMYSSPEFRIVCAEDQKQLLIDAVYDCFIQKADTSIITIDGARIITSYGWGLIRASNTQSVVSLRFESNNAEGLLRIIKEFAMILKEYVDIQQLSSFTLL